MQKYFEKCKIWSIIVIHVKILSCKEHPWGLWFLNSNHCQEERIRITLLSFLRDCISSIAILFTKSFAISFFEGFSLFLCVTAPVLKLFLQPLQQGRNKLSSICLYWILFSVLAGPALTPLWEMDLRWGSCSYSWNSLNL